MWLVCDSFVTRVWLVCDSYVTRVVLVYDYQSGIEAEFTPAITDDMRAGLYEGWERAVASSLNEA